jgi:hypothetical protein
MENFDNINTGFVKLICAYVKDIQKIDTDDLDDKLSPDSAIIKFLESRTLIHKSIKHRKKNYVEIDVIFTELPDFLFTITDNKISSPNTKDEAFWDWYENKSYIRSYIDPVNSNSNLVFCIENNFVEIKFKCPRLGYGIYDLQIVECLKLTCDKVKTLSI